MVNMELKEYFRMNAPQVVGEVLDDEVILVNLENGAYYSLNSTGSEIWVLIRGGVPFNEVVDVLKTRYPAMSGQMEMGVKNFLRSLREESLIVSCEAPQESSTPPQLPLAAKAFAPPEFSKYTDMADLLLLDPIHDVDEDGWPHARLDPGQKS
jgi:hypothetical protein